MSDRCHSLLVVLEEDLRADDDAKPLINAIKQMRGVISVTPNIRTGITEHMADERARFELGQKLMDVVYPKGRK